MNSFRIKYLLSLVVFIIGACMAVTPALTKENFELLLPGFVLIALSTPFLFYFRARGKSDRYIKSDEEILIEARREAEVKKGERNGEK